MGFNSQSITDTRVYAQDNEPTDTRNGNLWVDTSQNPPQTKVYSIDSGNWEQVTSPNFNQAVTINGETVYYPSNKPTIQDTEIEGGYGSYHVSSESNGIAGGETITLQLDIADEIADGIKIGGRYTDQNDITVDLTRVRIQDFEDNWNTIDSSIHSLDTGPLEFTFNPQNVQEVSCRFEGSGSGNFSNVEYYAYLHRPVLPSHSHGVN